MNPTVSKIDGSEPAVPSRLDALKDLFPEAFKDGVLDAEQLLEALMGSEQVGERFQFSWAGKQAAIQTLQQPTGFAVQPDEAQSVGWDTTKHIFIEGDNLHTLKAIYKSYFGSVKLIYIDPPYNTGSEFVYKDDYADSVQNYLRQTTQVDAEGNALTSKREVSGRLHSGWLSMMYPRLFLARQLLRDDGLIMISIDDHEQHHLRLLCNEVFGEENFIAQVIWDKTRKNDAKLFSVGHEYILIYARSLGHLKELGTIWRESKPGAKEILEFYREVQKKHGNDYAAMQEELRAWYRQLPETHPSKKLSRYKHIDQWGPWRDRDISWPGGGGPRYDVIHPITEQPCKVPEAGWRFSSPETMQKQIDLGLVVFREDHTQPPFRKAHLIPIPDELDEETQEVEEQEDDGTQSEEAVGLQVMPSYIYAQAQVSVKALRALMGAKVFENPKDPTVLARLIRYVTPPRPDRQDIILDFFAGSGTTGEAVLQANREDGGQRKFMLVQLPQDTPQKSAARKQGYQTIAELTRERLRRTAKQYQDTPGDEEADLGFRAFTMKPSHIRVWSAKSDLGYDEQMAAMLDPLVEGWEPMNVVWELALREGYPLTAQMGERIVAGNTVYVVTDPTRPGKLYVCLDKTLDARLALELAEEQEDLFICRDAALTDEQACNFALQSRIKVL